MLCQNADVYICTHICAFCAYVYMHRHVHMMHAVDYSNLAYVYAHMHT